MPVQQEEREIRTELVAVILPRLIDITDYPRSLILTWQRHTAKDSVPPKTALVIVLRKLGRGCDVDDVKLVAHSCAAVLESHAAAKRVFEVR
jgi:hypothetical protein